MSKKKKAIIYTRFSPRPNPDDCISLDVQENACREYCSINNMEVVGVYRDPCSSGRNATERVKFQNALQECLEHKYAFVVYSLSRFARSTLDAVEFAQILEKSGSDLVSVTENIDTTNAMGKFFFTIIAALGELERNQISERTKAAMQKKKEDQLLYSRPDRPPYGFRRHPQDRARFVEDEYEQRVAEEIRKLWHIMPNMAWIGRELKKRGFKPRTGEWNSSKIDRIVKRLGLKEDPKRGSRSLNARI